jgi:hypothetical protein
MQNHQAALPVAPEDELAAVYDSNGLPIVLSFSPDGNFYAVTNSPASPTGWQQFDLSEAVRPWGTMKSFAAGQLPNGNIFLAAAVQDISDASTQNLFIAGPLDPDLTKTNWADLSSLWIKSPNKAPGTTINRILVGSSDDGQGYGVPVIAASINTASVATISDYIVKATVDPNSGTISWNWLDFPTPTSMVNMLDYALGSISDLGAGVYMLYQGQGNQNWLEFKTLPNQYGRDYDRQFTVPAGATTLQTTPPVNGTTALYVGGSAGISWFSESNQALDAQAVSVATSGQVPDILRGGLIVRNDETASGTVAIWALSASNLYYINGPADGSAWSTPILFRAGVTRIAPLRNQVKYANELIYIGSDLDTNPNVYYMWQDPSTTLWKQDQIPLHATDNILELNTYTTRLAFIDANSQPVNDVSFVMTADAWLRVVINGTTQILDPDVPVTVQPDLQGVITVINSVNDLSAPLIHLEAPWFSGALDVDPAHKVYAGLSKVQAASDIPVLPSAMPNGVSGDDVASSIKGLMQFHPSSGSAQTDAVAYRAANTPATPRLSQAAIASNHTFGMTFAGGGLQYHDAAAVAIHPQMSLSLGSVGATLKDVGGDILEYLENAAKKVEHILVTAANGVVTFVVTLADAVASFVVKSFDAVYRAISWVFDQIEVAFEKLIDWLGFLFNWQDIVRTHRVFVNLVNQTFNYSESKIEGLEGPVTKFFESLKARVQSLEPIGGDSGATNIKSGTGQVQSKVPSSAQNGVQYASSGAGGNYAHYHVMHSGVLDYTGVATGASSTLMSFIDDVALPLLSSVEDTAQQLFKDMKAAFDGSALTPDQIIGKIAGDVIIGILDALEKVVVGLIQFTDDLVKQIQSALNDPVDIPFVSALYKKFVGSDMSVLDGLMLLCAVPVTLGYKLMSGKSPFSDSTYGMDTRDYNDLLKEILPSNPPQQRLAARAASAGLGMAASADETNASGSGTPTSNQVSECAQVYSILGGFLSTLTATINNLLSLYSAVLSVQQNQSVNPTEKGQLKEKISTIGLVQIGLATAAAAGSFPVSPGPERGWQFGQWGLSIADIVKGGLAAKLEDKQTAQKIIGGFEIAEGVAMLGLCIGVLVEQMIDKDNDQKGTDIFTFFPALLSSIGMGFSGATRIDTDKESQSVLAVVSGGCFAIAAFLNISLLGAAIGSGTVFEG